MKHTTLLLLLLIASSFQLLNAQTWSKPLLTGVATNQFAWEAISYHPVHGALLSETEFNTPYNNYLLKLNSTNGNTVWSQHNALTGTYFCYTTLFDSFGTPSVGYDTVHLGGIVTNIIRLKGNGHYIIGGFDTGRTYYMLRELDSNGTLCASYCVLGYSGSANRDINVIEGNNNEFYFLYRREGPIYVIDTTGGTATATMDSSSIDYTAIKFDTGFHIHWKKTLGRTVFSTYTTGTIVQNSVIDIDQAIKMSDGSIAYPRVYDTTRRTKGKRMIEKLKTDSTIDWVVNLQSYLSTSSSQGVSTHSLISTADTGIVTIGWIEDTLGSTAYVRPHIIRFNATGLLRDSASFLSDTSVPGFFGVELSNGNILLHTIKQNGFSLFNNHLNYLYSVANPFTENEYNTLPPIANPYGGAYCNYNRYNLIGSWPTYHVFTVNFDSNFHCFPANVSGHVFRDNSTDCIFNTGDIHLRYPVTELHNTTTGNYYYGIGNDTGFYFANVPLGNYTVNNIPPGYYATECGSYTYSITTPGTIPNTNFADTIIPGINELSISFYNIGNFVPGNTNSLIAFLQNTGTTTVDSMVTIVIDSRTTLVSASITPYATSGDTLRYLLHLLPDSFLYITFRLTSATSLTFTDTLTFTGTSSFPNTIVPWADSAVFRPLVRSSYDPNSKTVNQAYFFDKENTMFYTINFENDGTAPAKNVVVQDSLDARLDPATFQLISSSHNMPALHWLPGNRVLFSFEDIYLPDSGTSHTACQGHFTFSIKPKRSVSVGDTISNTAYIYFDYNKAVVTNTTTNVIKKLHFVNDIKSLGKSNLFQLFPNPSTDQFTIVAPDGSNDWLVTITDVSGRVVNSGKYYTQSMNISIDLNAGIYFVKLTNNKTQENTTGKLSVID